MLCYTTLYYVVFTCDVYCLFPWRTNVTRRLGDVARGNVLEYGRKDDSPRTPARTLRDLCATIPEKRTFRNRVS